MTTCKRCKRVTSVDLSDIVDGYTIQPVEMSRESARTGYCKKCWDDGKN